MRKVYPFDIIFLFYISLMIRISYGVCICLFIKDLFEIVNIKKRIL